MKMRNSFGLDRCDLERLVRSWARKHIGTVQLQSIIMHRKVPRCFRWNDSAEKLQIPSSKLQRSSKPQTSTRHPGWPPPRSGLGLELEIWSFSGAWGLGLGAFVRAAFHRKHVPTPSPVAISSGKPPLIRSPILAIGRVAPGSGWDNCPGWSAGDRASL
jgi:hypothetical protein